MLHGTADQGFPSEGRNDLVDGNIHGQKRVIFLSIDNNYTNLQIPCNLFPVWFTFAAGTGRTRPVTIVKSNVFI
ncbi:hypothetical protein [Larkinella soli]|uniref:hypothetical protein n=1 Tax=Larkinella soli TaxID=1770527 RepID=UPI0013E35C33|nr:hypothetical protein [Larkinella soli]